MAKKKPSKKTIIKAITEKEGNVSAAARKLNMNRCTLITWINKDEELKQVVEDERETIVDEIKMY